MKKVLCFLLSFMLLPNFSACRTDLSEQTEHKTHCVSQSQDVEISPLKFWGIFIGSIFVLGVTLCPHLHDKGWHKKDRTP
ncbi:MAG: hypothetical protein J6J35_08310 [Alphaproteobacteria bacterium]|nr:hypothetical protein [Alphaproteobacteria bacterium]